MDYKLADQALFVVFRHFIAPELATQYLAGAVLLGAAPCTAMVFVWSTLTHGNPAYTVVQVATNDLIILVAFVPIVKFLLGVSKVSVPYSDSACGRGRNEGRDYRTKRQGLSGECVCP